MAIDRKEPSTTAGEREMLDGWLDYHRATLEMKCEGLTAEQLKTRATPPSNLSLLGLVRHMAEVERGWFRRTLRSEQAPPLYYTDSDPDGDFTDLDDADPGADLATWREECSHARVVSAPLSLDEIGVGRKRRTGEEFSLRWIVTHMIEEYARHNGHADLLREAIDGTTGD